MPDDSEFASTEPAQPVRPSLKANEVTDMRPLKQLIWAAVCALVSWITVPASTVASTPCGDEGVHVQVLGSGGPESDDGRVSSSYLVWQDGQARLLVDMGSGSFSAFEKSGGRVKSLDALLFSHFHVDHANDLPALVKASWFIERSRDLPLFGPAGNDRMPGAQDFTAALFGPGGAYRYLGDFLDGRAAFRLLPEAIPADGRDRQVALERDDLKAEAVPVNHGPPRCNGQCSMKTSAQPQMALLKRLLLGLTGISTHGMKTA